MAVQYGQHLGLDPLRGVGNSILKGMQMGRSMQGAPQQESPAIFDDPDREKLIVRMLERLGDMVR